MNWIALDILGNVKGIFADRKDVDDEWPCVVRITPKAEALATAIGNVRENDRIILTRDSKSVGEMMIQLKEEIGVVNETDSYRVTLISRLAAMQRLGIPENPGSLPDEGDRAVCRWMTRTGAVRRIHSFSPEASALIASARIECDDVPEKDPVFFLSADPARPLFLNVMELMFTPGDDTDDNYTMTLMVTPGSTVRFLLSIDSSVAEHDENPEVRLVCQEARKFIDGYHTLLRCSNAPVVVRDLDEGRNARLEKKGIRITGGISRYQVSLSDRYRSMKRNRDPERDGKDGKVLQMVSVSGYIRNQPYGPGRQERKLIWVDGFVRGQWVRSGMTYITVTQ